MLIKFGSIWAVNMPRFIVATAWVHCWYLQLTLCERNAALTACCVWPVLTINSSLAMHSWTATLSNTLWACLPWGNHTAACMCCFLMFAWCYLASVTKIRSVKTAATEHWGPVASTCVRSDAMIDKIPRMFSRFVFYFSLTQNTHISNTSCCVGFHNLYLICPVYCCQRGTCKLNQQMQKGQSWFCQLYNFMK